MNCCDFKNGHMRPLGSLMTTSTQIKAEDPLSGNWFYVRLCPEQHGKKVILSIFFQ